MSKTFCPLPWMHLSQRNNGHYRVCCHSDTSVDKGLLRDSSGEFLHASKSSISEVRNSATLKSIRKAILDGRWHEQCSQCQKEEASGLRSPRLNELEKWNKKGIYENAKTHTTSDGGISVNHMPLWSYDIRLGNVCNLKCRMCGPMDSRTWYADYQKLHGIRHFKDTHGSVVFTDQNKNDPYLWFENGFFWRDLFEQRETIQSLYLVGGEPLLIEAHFDFLHRLVDSGDAGHIELIYNTNLMRLRPEMIDTWSHFQRVNFGVSLDGTFNVNDYIRAPSDFAMIEKNLELLDRTEGNFHIWLAPTVQMYNVLHIPDFLRWILTKNFWFLKVGTPTGLLFFHPLHKPEFLGIQTLPAQIKATIRSEYVSFFDELRASTPRELEHLVSSTVDYLLGLLDFMDAKDNSHRLPEFLSYTQRLDTLRNESFAEVFPRLHIMLQEFQKSNLFSLSKLDPL